MKPHIRKDKYRGWSFVYEDLTYWFPSFVLLCSALKYHYRHYK